ncbi:hypothetical protein I4U23_025386 [Adineta vaga]|nr:hypothetical protein I4U23_025386 [Adineta vaga]
MSGNKMKNWFDLFDDLQWNMNTNGTEAFSSLREALEFVGYTTGLHINESAITLREKSIWPSVLNLIPLSLGFIGLIFNILALLIFTASKTFRRSPFRCYIYAFVLANCASIFTYSWIYMVFYIVDSVRACRYIQYLQQSLSTTSLWIMVLLSFERSFTFIRPLTVKNGLKTRTICLILCTVTCSCFILHLDELISVDIKAFRWVNFAYGLCSVKRYSALKADRIKMLTHSHSFILPFLLNTILDIYICFKICQRRKRLLEKAPTILRKSSKFRRSKISLANEITFTLLWQSMWLLITYFPTHLYYSLISFKLIDQHDRDNSVLVFLIRLNLLIYLAFSPTLYVIFSPTLRREIRFHICQSYEQRKTLHSRAFFLPNKKSGSFLNGLKPSRLSILTIRSEELPRKFPPQTPLTTPIKYPKIYYSKSTPCLSPCINEYDLYQCIKTKRSSALFE